MTDTSAMTTDQIEDFACRALVAAGTADANARAVARSSAAAERDGIASHGLAYIPIYAEHVQCGKVDGQAVPVVATPAASMITVDAATGFAHPAIDAGFEKLIPLARANGIAALAINNSYNCGVLGYHTERLAEAGLVGIGFTNAPASIAPSGGSKPVVGTNPFSIAVPDGQGGAAIAIDQSASVIAKSEVSKHAREGKPIPEGWALDPDGNPTTDPAIGLKGSMVPSGGYKGVSIALMTEIMAAALAGATLGSQASPFAGTAGGPPRTGQFFIAIEPGLSSGGLFAERVSDLVASMAAQDGVHIPGAGRHSARARNEGKPIAINPATIAKIEAIIAG